MTEQTYYVPSIKSRAHTSLARGQPDLTGTADRATALFLQHALFRCLADLLPRQCNDVELHPELSALSRELPGGRDDGNGLQPAMGRCEMMGRHDSAAG